MGILCEIGDAELAEGLALYLCGKGFAAECPKQDALVVQGESDRLGLGLGLAIAWLMVNRGPSTQCTLRFDDDGLAQPFQLLPVAIPSASAAAAAPPPPPPPTSSSAASAASGPNGSTATTTTATTASASAASSAPSAAPSLAAPNGPNVDPARCVEVFHLHGHFNAKPGSEAAAVAMLASTAQAVTDAGCTPIHTHVWHEKNGPHDPWSWELWVDSALALGAAASNLMQHQRPGDCGRRAELGLYFAVHPDTDQEHSDHALRLGWFGTPDPRPLDVEFFPLPPASYAGVRSHVRQSSTECVYSMGEKWPLAADGTVVNAQYGAMDRSAAL